MTKPYTVAGLDLDLLPIKDAIDLLPTTVSERRFRETARAEGLNVLDGRQMMVRRNDITKVLEAMTCSKSKDVRAPRSGRSSAPLRAGYYTCQTRLSGGRLWMI